MKLEQEYGRAAGSRTGPRAWNIALTGMAALSLAIGLGFAWLWPRAGGDTFMALALGRDVMEGKLGSPDDWSFLTGDRVWVTSNWGTGLLFYLGWLLMGDNGLWVTKLLLLLALTGSLLHFLSTLQVDRRLGWVTVAAFMLANLAYIDLRPNLIMLIMTPLLLSVLLATEGERSSASYYWAPFLVLVWANTHASFVFAMGLFALWVVCHLTYLYRARLWTDRHDSIKALLYSFGLGVALAAVASPFGFANVTSAARMSDDPIWREVREWHPLLDHTAQFGSVAEFFVTLAVLIVLLAAWVIVRRPGTAKLSNTPATARFWTLDKIAFLALSTAAAIALAFASRRFVPLASLFILSSTALLVQAIAVQRPAFKYVATFMAAGAAIVFSLIKAPMLFALYSPARNPALMESDSLLQRMLGQPQLPSDGAIAFLNANGVQGRVLNEWGWEGYLHWYAPQLRLFMGGRAQTIYSAQQMRQYVGIRQGRDSADELAHLGVGLAILRSNNGLVPLLLSSKTRRWVAVYTDDRTIVLADLSGGEGSRLSTELRNGALIYSSSADAARSRVAYLASPAVAAEPPALLEAAEVSLKAAPSALVTGILLSIAMNDAQARADRVIPLLEDAIERSRDSSARRPASLRDLIARKDLLTKLAKCYAVDRNVVQLSRLKGELSEVKALIAATARGDEIEPVSEQP